MTIRTQNVLACLFRRPWIGLPFGTWLVVSVVYYWWLISKISVLETQNKVYKTQLTLSQTVMRQISVESLSTYQVPNIPDEHGTICETIHVSFVCMGKCSRQIMPMLKSMLHHRQNPIHFHWLVDYAANQTITKLFETWDLPDVKYTCYDAARHLSEVHWIPNSHYSGVYAFVKLLYPDILPATLKRVIVLDSDLTFLCDIAELWAFFRNMTDTQLIGLVENESNWYLDTNTHWPAVGRGYNTGVMLLDLHKIRTRIDWKALWKEAVNENIDRLKRTTLADQDVINAVIKKTPSIVYNISCQFNVQMSTKTLAKNCYREDRNNVKIIHWNSPSKHNISIRDAEYFRTIHQSYVNFDGDILREKLHHCWKTNTVYKVNNSEPCGVFRASARVSLRTLVHYAREAIPPSEGGGGSPNEHHDAFDVTLVLQLSMDRLPSLERLLGYWQGPVSAAIYLSDCEVARLEGFVRVWAPRRYIGYHLVFRQDEVHYPVNYLRNVALDNAGTPYVFLMDADFVPMAGLYDHLRAATTLINPYPQKKCLVVAAFETSRYRAVVPRSKPALVARLRTHGDVAPFRSREWPRGHRATDYKRWVHAVTPYEVEWESDYEPYLVVHRSVPRYDTRFSGFGWNKVAHTVALRAHGYTPVVLPAAFVVHTAHAPSKDIAAFRANPTYRVCLALLKQEFLEDLKKKYNVSFEDTKPDTIYQSQAKNLILNQASDTG